jgi:hypothetical protein
MAFSGKKQAKLATAPKSTRLQRHVMRCNTATPEYALSPSMEETSPGCMPEHASYSSLALAAGRKDGFSRTGAAPCWIISMVSPTETRFCRDIWQTYIP